MAQIAADEAKIAEMAEMLNLHVSVDGGEMSEIMAALPPADCSRWQ